MSWPNNLTSPVTREFGDRSCIRLRARRKVDLPQPLGPIMAVTALAGISIETFLSTWCVPKKTDRARTVRAGVFDDRSAAGADAG